MAKEIVVIGAGVIGLTTAVTLIEAGIRTRIITSLPTHKTTSNQAGALWHPFLVPPTKRVFDWSNYTYREFIKLKAVEGSGIFVRVLTEYFIERIDDLWWTKDLPNVERINPSDLPLNFVDGYKVSTLLVEPSIFLPYLRERFLKAGGLIHVQNVKKIEDVMSKNNIVVNCTGLGSRELCGDSKVYPIWGQTLLLSKNSEVESCIIDDSNAHIGFPTYIFPRTNDILLGGFAYKNSPPEKSTDANSIDILSRCRKLNPHIDKSSIIKAQVGDRPGREDVRLEFDMKSRSVIHNYGHSGSGFTLCWGCAQNVCDLVSNI